MNMNTLQQNIKETSPKDLYIWLGALVLLVAAIAVDHFFSSTALAIRLSGWLIVAAIIVLMVMQTKMGKRFWKFVKEARAELRKIVWPTRQEAVRTTAIVALLVLIAVLVMWGIDSILLLFINWLIK
jgi:preprotein translocase subunit SecE